jgi:hypothetical protein
MRRIQIVIEADVADALTAEAARTGKSKAALIRDCLSARFRSHASIDDDPITALVGSVDVEPADINEIVYGR